MDSNTYPTPSNLVDSTSQSAYTPWCEYFFFYTKLFLRNIDPLAAHQCQYSHTISENNL